MSWPCRLIDCHQGLSHQTLQIGDMFYFNPEKYPLPAEDPENPDDHDPWYWFRAFTKKHKLSDYYFQNNSHRDPLLVWLPGRTLFCVDGKCWKDGAYYGGWVITGEAPNITVHPSINIGGSYHGWLQNGVIGDDVDGRKFDDTGRQIR